MHPASLPTWLAASATVVAQAAFAQAAHAQSLEAADAKANWQQCKRLAGPDNDKARLACFDRLVQDQDPPATVQQQQRPQQPQQQQVAPAAVATQTPPEAKPPEPGAPTLISEDGCRDRQYSPLSRFWELEPGSSCGTFGFRGYRPLSVGLGFAANKPETATSPAPGRTAADQPYQAQDMRIGLSLRIKLAQGLLTSEDPVNKDAFWFGYSQASTWQVFNADLSRPFRTTDHEPEVMYTYPSHYELPGGWRLRYTGVGLVHQSNGQDLPYSRSWDRVYLMAGAELDNTFVITGRIWKRISEDAAEDDNPDITKYLGNAEVRVGWNVDRNNQLGVLVHGGKGAVKLEWLKAIGDPTRSNLRFYTQLFHGYGDTLIDYNRKRTVFTFGVALVDF